MHFFLAPPFPKTNFLPLQVQKESPFALGARHGARGAGAGVGAGASGAGAKRGDIDDHDVIDIGDEDSDDVS